MVILYFYYIGLSDAVTRERISPCSSIGFGHVKGIESVIHVYQTHVQGIKSDSCLMVNGIESVICQTDHV